MPTRETIMMTWFSHSTDIQASPCKVMVTVWEYFARTLKDSTILLASIDAMLGKGMFAGSDIMSVNREVTVQCNDREIS